MSRKHFRILAEQISYIECQHTRKVAALAAAKACEKINSNFKQDVFLTACGVI